MKILDETKYSLYFFSLRFFFPQKILYLNFTRSNFIGDSLALQVYRIPDSAQKALNIFELCETLAEVQWLQMKYLGRHANFTKYGIYLLAHKENPGKKNNLYYVSLFFLRFTGGSLVMSLYQNNNYTQKALEVFEPCRTFAEVQ